MSLSDDLQAELINDPTACLVGVWLTTLDPQDRQDMENGMNRNVTTKSGLFRVADKNGYTGSENTFRRHMRRMCGCVQL